MLTDSNISPTEIIAIIRFKQEEIKSFKSLFAPKCDVDDIKKALAGVVMAVVIFVITAVLELIKKYHSGHQKDKEIIIKKTT